LVTIEDAFLRSVQTGREGAPGLGIVADETGISFDTGAPSDLLTLLEQSADMSASQIREAGGHLAKLRHRRLSKYNAFDADLAGLPARFVLVLDQASKDASITLGGGGQGAFERMLAAARAENPDAVLLIKAHPEAIAGTRSGHFQPAYPDKNIVVWNRRTNPYDLFERASSVYCVTSQMGFEAMLAGHRPKIFGRPFFAGWGLSDDRNPAQVQRGKRSLEQVFAAAYLKYPIWYDPYEDCLCTIGRVMDTLQAQSKHWSRLHNGVVCYGFSRWKRPFVRRYFKVPNRPVEVSYSVADAVARAAGQKRDLAIWASKETPELRDMCKDRDVRLWRVEDGFIRSVGLGAAKLAPVSLVMDDLGVHYDPARPSRLERLIAGAVDLPDFELARARAVRDRILQARLTKYNLRAIPGTEQVPDTQGRQVILIVGQVEDDASVLLGSPRVTGNADLIRAVRKRYRDAYLLYKPHPDVEAGYRQAADLGPARHLVDHVAEQSDIGDLIDQCDRLCTMTSTAGFEALLRGKPVTTFGVPFYAGWGLTEDLGKVPARRCMLVTLDQLVHAALIDYPDYWDPISGAVCPVEVILDRFETGKTRSRSWFRRG
jgi:capsular polysaccharide export protein